MEKKPEEPKDPNLPKPDSSSSSNPENPPKKPEKESSSSSDSDKPQKDSPKEAPKKSKKKQSTDSKDDDFEKPSYTFWKRDSDIKADHKGFQPTMVNPSAQPAQPAQHQVGSAWNRAGTWEEKKLKKEQIIEFMNDYIKKNKKIYKDTFYLESFSDFSGDAYYVFSRGKIKFIYDFEIKCDIRENDKNGVLSHITIKEIANADLDEDFEYEYDSVTKKENARKYQIIQVFKANYHEIQDDIRKIMDALKDHYIE